jgi:hypothetical protein
MSRAKRVARAQAAGRSNDPAEPTPPPAGEHRFLWLAALATVAFFSWVRLLLAREPWSYDEYFHLAITRQWLHAFPVRGTPWAPHSLLNAHFADGELLYHLLLAPLVSLPLEWASSLGALLGQCFLVGAFAWAMVRLRAPGSAWLLLGLSTLGPLFAYRLGMCRPQLLLIAFTVVVVTLLVSRAPLWILAVACGLFGWTHPGGWIAMPFALVFGGAGLLLPRAVPDRAFEWRPFVAAALGWLVGQCVHPNLPENFRLLWAVNVTVVGASQGGSDLLRAMLGGEMMRLETPLLLLRWTACLPCVAALAQLWLRPTLRTRATLTIAGSATAFLVVGALFIRRMLDLGSPLGLLALAAVLAERERREPGAWRRLPRWLPPVWVALGAVWTTVFLLTAVSARSAPRAMAEWLGKNGAPQEHVFTAQWADAAPIFYFAPQVQTLVAMDPTMFWLAEPDRFNEYARIAFGQEPDPVQRIRADFGADLVTIQKAPDFRGLAVQLSQGGATRVYDDAAYQIWRLPPR